MELKGAEVGIIQGLFWKYFCLIEMLREKGDYEADMKLWRFLEFVKFICLVFKLVLEYFASRKSIDWLCYAR